MYSDKPLQGELSQLPESWQTKVLFWSPKRFWTQIRLSWEMLVNKPDILFIPAHVPPVIHPKKTVMTVHDVAALRFPNSFNWFERWYSIWSARRAVKKLWKIIVPSEFTKREIKLLFKHSNISTKQDKIFVVNHGYNKNYRLINNEEEVDKVLEKYKIKKPFIMTIGRLEEKKNTKRIVEVFNKLKKQEVKSELQLVLIGKPGYGYEEVKEVIQASQYKEDIVELGWVDEKEVPYLMNGAKVFVFPSLYEGFGLPVLEAMACGLPVIASKDNSLEEVGGKAGIYVEADNSEEIVKSILEFLHNEDFKKEKITLGLERVKVFSWCKRQTLYNNR